MDNKIIQDKSNVEDKQPWWKQITVEPLIFGFAVTLTITGTVVQNLILQKVCFSDLANAPEPGTDCPKEDEAEHVLAGINGWKPFAEYLIPFVFILFVGSWSDNHGRRRKPLMMIPLIGTFVSHAALLLCVYVWNLPPVWVGIAGTIPVSITGSKSILTLGVTSYLTDITTTESRTRRFSIAMGLMLVGMGIGASAGGIALEQIGFYPLLWFCLIVDIHCFVYVVFFIRENVKNGVTESKFFDITLVTETLKTLFKPREGYLRSKLLICFFLPIFTSGILEGEILLFYMFTRNKFGWTSEEYGIFFNYKTILQLVGTVTGVWIMSKKLRLHDCYIGMVGLLLNILGSILYIFATSTWQLFIIPFTDVLLGGALSTQRSFATKLIPEDEIGKIISVTGAMDCITPIAIAPLYTITYRKTLDTMPEAYFLLQIGFAITGFLLFGLLYILDKKDEKHINMHQEH